MVWFTALHLLMAWTIFFVFGWGGLKHQLVYSLVGAWYLEMINYIEHYGLLRMKDSQGISESINRYHSWNAVSSPVLFRIQRHSDHHAHSFRPYQILRRFDDAPYMPFEYMQSTFIIVMPPLWFALMNPRVDAIKQMQQGKTPER